MTEKEMMKISVEEFARVQKYMLLIDNKDSAVYKEIRGRYMIIRCKVSISVWALHLFFLP